MTLRGDQGRSRELLRRVPFAVVAVRRVKHWIDRIDARLLTRSYWSYRPAKAVRIAYNVILDREPDDGGLKDFIPRVRSGTLSRSELTESLRSSDESLSAGRTRLSPSVHQSRCAFVRMLPKADRILDLGGTNLGNEVGALVSMGYPYRFSRLVIVDLPHTDRHELYQQGDELREVSTVRGSVQYRYHSMVDLSGYADDSFDLVYSGQTIEHIEEEEADRMLRSIRRVLRPNGFLAIDTPNGRATRMQQEEFIDPDHKVEYSIHALREKVIGAGFVIREERGLSYLGDCLDDGIFTEQRVAQNPGIYSTAEDCYLLALLCQPLPH